MLLIAFAVVAYSALIGVARRTMRGRALNHHPYGNPYVDAPGARAPSWR